MPCQLEEVWVINVPAEIGPVSTIVGIFRVMGVERELVPQTS